MGPVFDQRHLGHAFAAEQADVVVHELLATTLGFDTPFEILGDVVEVRGHVPTHDPDRRTAPVSTGFVHGLGAATVRFQELVAIEILLLVILHVADLLELEDHPPLVLGVHQKAGLFAAGAIAGHLEELLGRLGFQEAEPFGDLQIGAVGQSHLGRALDPGQSIHGRSLGHGQFFSLFLGAGRQAEHAQREPERRQVGQ